ncbi:hypothetical protein GCM10023115_01550 [Pontixanthobacter gangjinensis]|uniref:General glycosylation pathway protein n=1 Tax=Pontixanthobacter gangjinensis TaxID=1028742 RepID=A0A6I4SI21_9SPHN|nr:hypothetical protein [Pontixanthobacter gangjinensis]MXO55411.1 hypothetical protein [Pontixanthobacter gangjinensis]
MKLKLKPVYDAVSRIYFIAATISLLLLAMLMLVIAIIDVVNALATYEAISTAALQSVGLLIIGFAIVETAAFIAEEEIFSKRELRSSSESRQSLTGFVTIIVIASSLEALVMIFSATRLNVSNAVYAAAIFFVAMFSLICLGIYQWLSSRIRPGNGSEDEERD